MKPHLSRLPTTIRKDVGRHFSSEGRLPPLQAVAKID